MQKLLPLFIGLGAVIGLMAPTGHGKPPRASAPPLRTQAAAPVDTPSIEPSGTTVLKRSANGHFYVDAEVNGGLARFVVDTGASTVALTEDDARRLGIPFSEASFTTIGRGASGDVRGTPVTIDRLSIEGKEARAVSAVVVQDLDVSLLGQTYLTRLGSVSMSGDEMRLQ
jgi:aspartyl protease family protein